MRTIVSPLILLLCIVSTVIAQKDTGVPDVKSETNIASQTSTSTQGKDKDSGDDVIRVDTNLVTIPVTVIDREGRFVADLSQKDFQVYEEGVEQQIAYFAPVEQPFTVVLLLDTSPSTKFRLKDIQDAAISFIDQLRPEDRAVGVTFNSQLHVLNRMMRDREGLRQAIRGITSAPGTYLYATVDVMLNRLFRQIPGRKALVIFTDGVDNLRILRYDTKRRATFASNMRDAEESEVLIYPIQYNTLEDVRQIAQGSDMQWLWQEYELASSYLSGLAKKTGGRLYRADNLEVLRQAFSEIAEDLRHQYSIGYYPKVSTGNGQVRKIKVRVRRTNVAVKAKDSYNFSVAGGK
jgi:Ca-activated chloride channel homolog